jgi:hypothetical protein
MRDNYFSEVGGENLSIQAGKDEKADSKPKNKAVFSCFNS